MNPSFQEKQAKVDELEEHLGGGGASPGGDVHLFEIKTVTIEVNFRYLFE